MTVCLWYISVISCILYHSDSLERAQCGLSDRCWWQQMNVMLAELRGELMISILSIQPFSTTLGSGVALMMWWWACPGSALLGPSRGHSTRDTPTMAKFLQCGGWLRSSALGCTPHLISEGEAPLQEARFWHPYDLLLLGANSSLWTAVRFGKLTALPSRSAFSLPIHKRPVQDWASSPVSLPHHSPPTPGRSSSPAQSGEST